MRLSYVICASLALIPALGFQPVFQGLSSRTPSPTQLFLADQIKDYKKGLSKISGSDSVNRVRLADPSLHCFYTCKMKADTTFHRQKQVVSSSLVGVLLPTTTASIMLQI